MVTSTSLTADPDSADPDSADPGLQEVLLLTVISLLPDKKLL